METDKNEDAKAVDNSASSFFIFIDRTRKLEYAPKI